MKSVVFCLPGTRFSHRALKSWTQLYLATEAFGIYPILATAASNNIYHVRNYCLMGNKYQSADQKPFQGKIDYDYLMWLDSDIVYTPKDVKTLFDALEHYSHIHILGGLYCLENQSHFAANLNQRRLTPKDIRGLTAPFKVNSVGLGFTLVRHGVFESLSFPWFQPLGFKDDTKNHQGFLGDDVSFCHRAHEQGFKSYILPRLIVGHEKPVILR